MIRHCKKNLDELADAVHSLSNEQYAKPINTLSNASVGQHVRHVLEFYICLLQGQVFGVVNYDLRNRDYTLENSVQQALETINSIKLDLDKIALESSIRLEGDLSVKGDTPFSIESSMERELAYNIEHGIHHQALIKIGLRELGAFEVNTSFGVAASTLRSN